MQMHGMKNLGLHKVELLGSDCATPLGAMHPEMDDGSGVSGATTKVLLESTTQGDTGSE